MALKVKNECVNPANGQRQAPGSFLDPVPNADEVERLKKANAIAVAPDSEFEDWKKAEADRARQAQEEAAKRAAGQGRDLETRVADLERKVADLTARFPAPPTPARPVEGRETPEGEKQAEEEIKRRAGQRPGDDNDQRKSK